jgi:nicotinamide-nucleotide adenylyltransferase
MGGEKEIIDDINRGLMIGRFQPFHRGHLSLANEILSECEELVVAIGSPEANLSFSDPFTSGERITMIHESLKNDGLSMSRCYILPVPNSANNYVWFSQMKSMLPKVTTVYSGNEYVRLLLPKDIRFKSPTFVKNRIFNGTRIRKLMACNGRWENLVPSPVALLLREVDGVSRLSKLARTQVEQRRVLGNQTAK